MTGVTSDVGVPLTHLVFGIPVLIFQVKVITFGTNVELNMLINISSRLHHI